VLALSSFAFGGVGVFRPVVIPEIFIFEENERQNETSALPKFSSAANFN
jgi:hypothetical protein